MVILFRSNNSHSPVVTRVPTVIEKSGEKWGVSRSEILKLVREKLILAKVKEFYDEVVLVVQLLSFSDKRLRQFLPFSTSVVIINIYTHFVAY